MKRTILMLVVLMIAGCASKEPRSVQWFKDHETERKALIEKCNQNAVPTSVECLNAQKADNALSLSRRGYAKPHPIDFD